MTDTYRETTGEATETAPSNGGYQGEKEVHSFSSVVPQLVVHKSSHEPDPNQTVRRMTRQMAQEMRSVGSSEGVPMWMDRTGFEATVLPLSFADKTMMQGIDPRLQAEITAGFNARGVTSRGGSVTFADMIRGIGNEARLSNALCVAGFLSPRLTLTKEEADRASDEEVWWVEELHIEDRRKYGGYVLGQDDAEVKRIANFLADRVASTGNS